MNLDPPDSWCPLYIPIKFQNFFMYKFLHPPEGTNFDARKFFYSINIIKRGKVNELRK